MKNSVTEVTSYGLDIWEFDCLQGFQQFPLKIHSACFPFGIESFFAGCQATGT
jgi:hypothetical protein